MRVHLIPFAVLVLVASACAEPDTVYGEPNGIIGRTLPKEPAGSGAAATPGGNFGGAYNANEGKPATTLRKGHAPDPTRPAPDAPAFDCMDCHKVGGTAAAKAFDFGGRVASKKPGIDVMVISGGAKLGPVKSDDDGYFWKARTTGVADKSHAFARNGSKEAAMSLALGTTGGGCDAQSCHATQQDPVGTTL